MSFQPLKTLPNMKPVSTATIRWCKAAILGCGLAMAAMAGCSDGRSLVTSKADGTTKQTLEDNLVVLMYHHVSTETPAVTSISPQMFEQHLDYLANNHHVVALPDALGLLQQGGSLPPKSVAITFDDGYRNILENAHPLLRKYGFDYTIFINPDPSLPSSTYLTFDDMRSMQNDGVTFANHTMDHRHLIAFPDGRQAAMVQAKQDIERAQQILERELNITHRLLAYPYGEFNHQLASLAEQLGFIAFGQHSGALNSQSNRTTLPRFPASGRFANLESLAVKLNSLALNLNVRWQTSSEQTTWREEVELQVTQETGTAKLPELQLSIREPANTSTAMPISFTSLQLQCFFEGEPIALSQRENHVVIEHVVELAPGRYRINCTAGSGQKGRFYWHSVPIFVADANGLYPE